MVLILYIISILYVIVVMVWGWVRWLKGNEPRTPFSIVSLIGFVLSTLSGLLAVSSVIYALAIGFMRHDPSQPQNVSMGGMAFPFRISVRAYRCMATGTAAMVRARLRRRDFFVLVRFSDG